MIVSIDFETSDSRGASFQYFRNDFKIFSLSCCWRDDKGVNYWFSTDSNRIAQKLASLARDNHLIIAHNLGYEMGCMKRCYPHIKLNWYCDTMRMAQLRDGGGDEYGPVHLTLDQEIAAELGEISEKDIKKIGQKSQGLSLEACARRFLPNTLQDHKKPAHDWLEENLGIKKNHGGHLDRLPYDLLKDYNNADTLTTLLIYESCKEYLDNKGFDWTRDCKLYFTRANLMTGAHIRGIKINSSKLLKYILTVEEEIMSMETEFINLLAEHVEKVRENRLIRLYEHWVNDLKTDSGKNKRRLKVESGEMDDVWKVFNIGSSKQLVELFVGVLGMTWEFETPKGSPSFKTTHLHQWGKGGLILQKRRKRLLVLQQSINVYASAMYDGRTHPSVRISGTRTNRVAGGRD